MSELEGQLDQTLFAEEAVTVDRFDPEEPTVMPEKNNKARLYLLALVGLLAAFVFGGIFLVMLFRRPTALTSQTEESTPETTTQVDPLERQLLILKNDIEQADPLSSALAFPPVNFKLDLQDATVLQQNP